MQEKIWKILGFVGIFFILWMVAVFLVKIFPSLSYFLELRKTSYYSPSSYGEIKSSTGMAKEIAISPKQTVETTDNTFKSSPESPSRMIIKSGWLNLVVKNINETVQAIIKFTEENDGWIVSSNLYQQETIPSGYITLRVPADKFDIAMNYFKKLAVKISNESTQAQDITEEYVDLESKLKNLESAEKQLLEIMSRAGKMSEVLEVHRELTNIRNQIEQTKGRMQYLERNVQMSSITVNLALSEELLPVPPAEKWRPKYVLLQAWKNTLKFWKEFSYFLIRLTVWAQVWVPALIIIIWGRRWWQKRKAKT